MPRSLESVLADVPFFRGLDSGRLALLAGCAGNVHFAAGESIFREGEPADTFYIVRHGSVALETFVPARGPVMIETIEAGEVVGWSWLFAPYRWHLDARALTVVRATGFDGACLRQKCEDDPAARLRPDGPLRAGADRAPAVDAAPTPRRLWQRRPSLSPRPAPMTPLPFVVADRAHETADTWTLTLEPVDGDGLRRRAGSVRDGLRLRRRRGADLRERAADRPGPVVLTVRAVGAVTSAICAAAPGTVLGLRGPVRQLAGRSSRPRGRTSSSSPAGSGLAPLRRAPAHARPSRRLRRRGAALRGAHAGRPALHRSARAGARPSTSA